MDEPIIELMNNKISQLERYNELTSRIIYTEDIDSVGEILDERQDIITVMDGISLDIRRFISEQSIEHREELNALMNSESIGNLNSELLELQNKIKRAAELKIDIVKNDERAVNRLKREHDELRSKLEAAAKGKQVADYFAPTAVDITKGSRLNISN